jgi:phosphoenolpyruvate phosphomutase/phosphonopyruvate hydrolase
MSRGAQLRARIAAAGLAHAMSAHNPLSARLAEEAGFDAIWASGFELSAAYGVPDASLLSYGQHLDMTRAMAEQTALPVIADLDTGYGNAVNVMHVVSAYERAGAAAVVIEDKRFPKDTSLLAGGRQELVGAEEFTGKIAAALSVRRDAGFVVIARTEALIAGLGQDEALARARAYADAGADLVLVHSKQRTPDEVMAFIAAWDGPVPLALVPTLYPDLDEARMRAMGKVGLVIYGNHAIRAAVTAMQAIFRRIRAEGGIAGADRDIVTVEEIFRLQRVAEMKAAERRFIP